MMPLWASGQSSNDRPNDAKAGSRNNHTAPIERVMAMGGIFAVVRLRVENYERWKPGFDEHEPVRVRHGAKGHQLLRSADDPNDLMIVIRFASRGGAITFFESVSLLTAIERAGVVGGAHHQQWQEELREEVESVEYWD
jgi:hypothetical protein